MRDQHRHVWRRKTHVSRHLPDWLELVRIIPTVNSILLPRSSAGTRVSISGWKREENSVYFRSIS